ncbi:MAG: hypothetical protein GC159_23105 [Phycisphaera sp.]|nr:hypothetical protein [Phycisphaera sp.]
MDTDYGQSQLLQSVAKMNLEYCNGFLAACAAINNGTNHGCDYVIDCLDEADSLDDALAMYFSSMSTSLVPQQSADRWNITKSTVMGSWKTVIERRCHHWFFEQQYSPRFSGESREAMVSRFIECFSQVLRPTTVHKIEVVPPMFYECAWEDFAFESGASRWLLHFGISD